jgi:effector-binding domain-containing protein
MEDVRLVDGGTVALEERSTVAIRYRRPMAGLDVGTLFGGAMTRLSSWLGERGLAPGAGAPYARYHEFGSDGADIEMGVPLESVPADSPPLSRVADGEVGASSLPAGEVMTVVHVGPYPTLGHAYRHLEERMAAEGRRPSGAPWEEYLDDPSLTDPRELRTLVAWPVT